MTHRARPMRPWAVVRAGVRAVALQAALLLALAAPAPATAAERASAVLPETGAAADAVQPEEPAHWRAVFKLVGLTAHAHAGEAGHVRPGDDTREATEQSLRIQLTGQPTFWLDWRLDYLNVKRDGVGGAPGAVGAELFRYKPARRTLLAPRTEPGQAPSTQTVTWQHELDHAFVRVAAGPVEAVLGRQPITWGVGRVWQPTDVFAAFSPLALDTEYKPGVDGLLLSAYPLDFATVQGAYVLSPAAEPDVQDSTALRWRSLVGDASELTLLAGRIRGESRLGGSLETALWQAGWRLEAVTARPPDEGPARTFAIAGVDHRLGDGTLLLLEWYRNSEGAASETDLARVSTSPAYREGRLPQLSQSILAASASQEFLGLWSVSYLLFAATLRDAAGGNDTSLLHRLTFTYSVSDEAEAVFSFAGGSGKGLGADGSPRSEFGHVPDTVYAAIQFVL